MEGALSPRLVGISGPVEGEVFGLSDGHLSIGRDSSNQLPIDDPSIAPCHCRIRRREGEEFEIQDLGSQLILEAVGPRYSVGMASGQLLWSLPSNLKYVLANSGIGNADLVSPLSEAGIDGFIEQLR